MIYWQVHSLIAGILFSLMNDGVLFTFGPVPEARFTEFTKRFVVDWRVMTLICLGLNRPFLGVFLPLEIISAAKSNKQPSLSTGSKSLGTLQPKQQR